MTHSKSLTLFLFDQALDNVVKVARVLRASHGLMIGLSGVGKQTTVRLSAFIAQCELISQSGNGFRDRVKEAMRVCAVKNERCVLAVASTQDPMALEDVNSLLSQGEVPNLWSKDEIEENENSLKQAAKEASIHDNVTLRLFLPRVQANLHICLCMSPADPQFKSNLRMFPAILNNCQSIWFHSWPQTALE